MAAAKKNGNDNKMTVAGLLKELAACKDQDEKKKIRRSLRVLGHKGGLRKPKVALKPAAKKSHKKPATSPAPAVTA